MLPSEMVRLGRTAVHVSRLGLGTAPMGSLPESQHDEARAIVRRAVAAGIRLIDTAPLYGYGEAETRIGEVLPELDRDSLVISTKVGRIVQSVGLVTKATRVLRHGLREPSTAATLVRDASAALLRRAVGRHPGGGPRLTAPDAVRDFSFDGALRSVEESMSRLRADRIDVLLIHEPGGPLGPVMDGAYRALERLRGEGTVSAIGVGLNDADALAAYARAGDFDCLLLGCQYTLMDQRAGRSLLPLAKARGISIILGCVFNSGILADPRPGITYNYRPASDANLRHARRLQAITERHGVPLKAAALQFPFRHSAITSVLTGVRTSAELDENVALLQTPIPGSLWDELRSEGLLVEVESIAV